MPPLAIIQGRALRFALYGTVIVLLGVAMTSREPPDTGAAPTESMSPEQALGAAQGGRDTLLSSIGSPMAFSKRSLCDGGSCRSVLLAQGRITKGSYYRLVEALNKAPNITTICLNSGGGKMNESLAMALEIRQQGRDTCALPEYTWEHRPPTQNVVCASGCGLMFFGGLQRFAQPNREGRTPLGIHQFRFSEEGMSNNTTANTVQKTYAMLSGVLRQLGIREDLLMAAARVPADSVRFLDDTEIRAYRAATHLDHPVNDAHADNAPPQQSPWSFLPPSAMASDYGSQGLAVALIDGRKGQPPFQYAQVMAGLGLKKGQRYLLMTLVRKPNAVISRADLVSASRDIDVALGVAGSVPTVNTATEWLISDKGITAIIPLRDAISEALINGDKIKIWTDHAPTSGLRIKGLPLQVAAKDKGIVEAVLQKNM